MMNKVLKRLVSAFLASALVISAQAVAFADTNDLQFTDMPNDWRTTAIENAVKNGLISGMGDGTVAPDSPITRAQMATIIVKALGATEKADISMFVDMQGAEGVWYYEWMEKAVYMNAFAGDGSNLNPNNNITFEECFTVLSKIFGIHIRVSEANAKTALSVYDDGAKVQSWATRFYGAMVLGGYWTGGEKNLLTPQEKITRGEFAVVMDNLIKAYISEPGEVTTLPEGNVVVRCDGVILDGITHKGDLIISDCVGAEKISLNNINVSGRLVYRGCATPGWRNSKDSNGNISKVWSYTTVGSSPSGKVSDVHLLAPYISVNIAGLSINPFKFYTIEHTNITTDAIN